MKKSEQTKRELAAAFKELLKQTPFHKINVSDIAGRTGVSRKSFYYHYRDKYDLVVGVFEREFAQHNKEVTGGQWLRALCGYIYEQQDFYRSVMAYEGQNSFEEYMGSCLRQRLVGDAPVTEEDHFCAVLLSDGLLAMIKRWLAQEKMLPPPVFVDMLRRVSRDACKLWN